MSGLPWLFANRRSSMSKSLKAHQLSAPRVSKARYPFGLSKIWRGQVSNASMHSAYNLKSQKQVPSLMETNKRCTPTLATEPREPFDRLEDPKHRRGLSPHPASRQPGSPALTADAGITGLTAAALHTPVWVALLATNPLTLPIAVAVGARLGGYAAYKLLGS